MIHSHNNMFLRLFMSALALALFAGCSDDDDPAGGGPADTTPPAVASVTAIDGSHIDVTFNEDVQRESAEEADNYVIVETAVPLAETTASPGDTLIVWGASLGSDRRTVSLVTGLMNAAPYDLGVEGVSDESGNTITTPVVSSFTGSTDPDNTPPELVYRSPGPNATGVPLAMQVVLTFTDAVTYGSFVSGFTLSSGAGNVPYLVESDDEGIHVIATPTSLLELGTVYTIALTGIQDNSGNTMADVSWTFTTTNTVDTTPPRVDSTVPANGTTNVDVNSVLSITFSEPINPATLAPSLYPDVGDGDMVWSNGGKTITFTPYAPLIDNQQYTLTVIPGSFADLAGNTNTQFTQVRFSTGSSFAVGSIEGTLAGDPGSDYADDPSGARVFAAVGVTLDDLMIGGSAVAATNNTFDIGGLSDDAYLVLSLLDSNADGALDPSLGDAIGAYGVDFTIPDLEPDIVTITGGSTVTGIDFQLFDASAITGTVTYSGSDLGAHYVGVGLFSTVGFDPTDPPIYGTDASWPGFPSWGFLSSEDGVPDGSYYVGAFLDTNDNFTYEPGTDPAGFYGGLPPTAVTIQNGSDRNGLVITIEDPPVSLAQGSVTWRAHTKRTTPGWVSQLTKAINESESQRAGKIRAGASREKESGATTPEISSKAGWGR